MATSELTLETDTEVFKGDRVIADGVERSLGDVTTTGTADSLTVGTATSIATYRFEGNANDLSGNYNGTVVGTPIYADGKFGQSYTNSTDGQYVNLPSMAGLTGDLTFSIHFKLSEAPDSTTGLFDGRNAGSIGNIFGFNDSNSIIKDVAGNATTSALSVGVWYTFIATNTIATNTWAYKTYLEDGTLFSSTSFVVARSTAQAQTQIGASNNSASYSFRGQIDQARFFTKVLTPTEVTDLYTEEAIKYSADFNTPLASTPTSVYRLDHDNLTIDGTPTATTATVLDSRTGLIASGDTVLLDGVGVVCDPVVETDVSVDSTNTHDIFGDSSAIATYKLDGDATDLGGNYNGTTTNVTYASDTVNGRVTDVGVFNGSSSKIATNLSLSNTPFSISFLAKGQTKDIYTICTSSGSTKSGVIIQANGISGNVNFRLNNLTTNYFNFATPCSFSTWKHIVCSFDNTTNTDGANIYIDGLLANSATATGINNYTHSYNTTFMADPSGGNYYQNGSMDQVRIFDRALTATEVEALYNEAKTEYQYDLTYPTQTAPTRIALANNDIVPTVASDTFDGADTFTKTYSTVTKTARDVEYGFVADEEVEIVQLNLNQNMEP